MANWKYGPVSPVTAPVPGKFLPDQEGTGSPTPVLIVGAVVVVVAAAVVTFPAWVVGAGVVVDEPLGNVQVANDCPGKQAAPLETFKVSEPELPVSTDVLMNKLLVVLG